MKRSVCFIAVAAILVLLVGGCAIPRACPEEGIWYCQELDIYLNMENGTGMYLSDNGGYEPLFVDIDYGTGFFIRFCGSSSRRIWKLRISLHGLQIPERYSYTEGSGFR